MRKRCTLFNVFIAVALLYGFSLMVGISTIGEWRITLVRSLVCVVNRALNRVSSLATNLHVQSLFVIADETLKKNAGLLFSASGKILAIGRRC